MKEYSKPSIETINLKDDSTLVALARCNGGAWTSGTSACS